MTAQLTAEQMQTLGIEHLSYAERDQFLQRIGGIVFDSAIYKLMETFSEEQMAAFTHAVDSYDSFSSILEHIKRTYPAFDTYLLEAQESFTQDFVQRVASEKIT